MFEEQPREANQIATFTDQPHDEPTLKQAVNAICWSINKLGAKIVTFTERIDSRAGRIEERIERIEECLASLHEEQVPATESDKEETT